MASSEFDKLGRFVQRQINLAEPIPPLFVKQLLSLDKAITNAAAKDKESKKKTNATTSRAMATMKQKVKKTLKDNEVEVKAYTDDPDAFEANYNALIAASAAPATKPRKAPKEENPEGENADRDFTTVGKAGKSEIYTAATVFKTLATVQESRGRKVLDKYCLFSND